MIDLKIVLAIILIHWLADFVFQTDKMARGKSKNWNDLLSHTGTYSVIWLIPIIFLFPKDWTTSQYVLTSLLFALITFIAHTITDYFTSRLNSKLAPKEETIMLKWDVNQKEEPFVRFPNGRSYHNLFVSIGVDQASHLIQLILTYYFLVN